MCEAMFFQKLKVVPVEKKLYGKFHTGDSYIVLEVSMQAILLMHHFVSACISWSLNHYIAIA